MMFTAGDKLEYGHYTVLRELGAGGMGVVYHCRDEFLQRDIAIKMLLPELMADDDTVEVFRQEARLAAQLEHPNVVTIHNIGLENREGKVHHYIAMEFLPGGSLKQRITANESSHLEQCLEWMKQMTVGLNYAHKRGVVHQDIKPDNIFITQDGNLKIGDFGLALIATGVAIERAVQGKGTPAYMSPELCRGDPQDHRSDIYSLGAVFYELLTNEKPYKASGMIEMAMKHATAPIPSAKKIRTEVPEVLNKAIQKMMAKAPDDRYQSLSDVLAILEKLLLEMQVARLGVGTPKMSEPEPAPVASEKVPPPSAIPNQGSYADDFANFVADKAPGKAPALPKYGSSSGSMQKPALESPAPIAVPKTEPLVPKAAASSSTPAADPLDDLLDSLLMEASPPPPSSTMQATKAASAAAEPVAPEAATPPLATPGAMSISRRGENFEDDVTGDIDAIFQSVVRAEAAAMAQAAHAEAEAKVVGKVVTGPSGVTDESGAAPRQKSSSASVGQKDLNLAWTFKTQGPIGWASMPVLSKDRKLVYIGSTDGCLYALDIEKGNVQWRYDTGAAVIASPVNADNRILIASTNGSLHALTPNGSKIWEYTSASPLVATPLVHNDSSLLSSMDGTVKFINHNDGSVKWTYRTDGPVVSSPAILENLVFVGSRDKNLHAISLDRGYRQWLFPTDGPIVSSPLVSTDSVYIGSTDGTMYAVEAETGKIVWKYRTDKAIVAKGTLEFTSVTLCTEDKWLHCIEKYKGGLMWKARLHSPVLGSLTSALGNLYVANREGWLQCFNLRDGEIKWQMNVEKRLESSPLVAGKMLFQGTVAGDLFAYNLP